MINPDTGEPRPPGGSEHVDEFGVNGVDYANQLIPWCKGNSVSVDQTTLQLYRTLISALVENYKSRIRLVDAIGSIEKINHTAGLTSRDIKMLYGDPTTRATRRYATGEPTRNWKNAESLFVNLLVGGHISLYSSNNTLSNEQSRIIKDINNDLASKKK